MIFQVIVEAQSDESENYVKLDDTLLEVSNNRSSSSTESLVVNPNIVTTTANAADVSNCKLNGSADGIQQKFDLVKYQACGLYTNAEKAYYDGFVVGCMQVGNTKLICETVANSNIVTPTVQTPTQTTAIQPIQAIQPAAVN